MSFCLILVFFISSLVNFHKAFIVRYDPLARCPTYLPRNSNLKVHGRYCYQFVMNQERYWHDARKDCQSRRGDLVVVDTSDIQNFLFSTIKSLHFQRNGVWIGLHDEAVEEHWEWTNRMSLGYNNWAPGEGDDFFSDCAHLRVSDGGKWHDSPCEFGEFRYAYVCQYNLLPPPTVPTRPSTRPTIPTTTERTTLKRTTMKPTTMKQTKPTTKPSTMKVTTMKYTTRRSSTSKPITTMAPTKTTVIMACPAFMCTLDCGILGYKVGADGCPLCDCQL